PDQIEYFGLVSNLCGVGVQCVRFKCPTLAVSLSNPARRIQFVDGAFNTKNTMSRPMRASARLARCLWELSKSGKIRVDGIYRQMAFGNQTDKEFAIPGSKWRKYVTSPRIPNLILSKDVLSGIIQPGYIKMLKPERRFDQTLYFTVRGQII
ncbi:MAG: HindVP family restriction endonuclease, partial [Clostridiales Family XIII bacterium]|nr:HindVP family restriction endonuclease [Clostridiales Family XIII bacterium]